MRLQEAAQRVLDLAEQNVIEEHEADAMGMYNEREKQLLAVKRMTYFVDFELPLIEQFVSKWKEG